MGFYKAKTWFDKEREFTNREDAASFVKDSIKRAYDFNVLAQRRDYEICLGLLDDWVNNQYGLAMNYNFNPLRIHTSCYPTFTIYYEGTVEYQIVDENTREILCVCNSEEVAEEIKYLYQYSNYNFRPVEIKVIPKEG